MIRRAWRAFLAVAVAFITTIVGIVAVAAMAAGSVAWIIVKLPGTLADAALQGWGRD